MCFSENLRLNRGEKLLFSFRLRCQIIHNEVAQSCLILCDPLDCSLPGSSVRGIFQARILEWVAISFSRGSSWSRDWTQSPTLQADTLPSEPPGKPKFSLKMKKVGRNTRSFWYDLNQIPCDYTVEVTNRFKGLNLIDIVPEELWMEVYNNVQEAVIKTIPKKRNAKRQNGCLRRPCK